MTGLKQGDSLTVLREMAAESVHCVVTSPPYWGLRDYGTPGQLGLEVTPDEYVRNMVNVFREIRRVLREDGTLWLNLGDSYAAGKAGRTDHGTDDPTVGLSGNSSGAVNPGPIIPRKAPPGFKPKDLVGIPWRVAFALQADGWYLRSDIIWSKPNPMPESVTDRPTKAHEYLFLMSKSARYYYDADAIREASIYPEDNRKARQRPDDYSARAVEDRIATINPANARTYPYRNRRSVWEIATQPYPEAHFATFPEALVEPCIKAGCPKDGTVLDPFAGSGTTLAVAKRLGREYIGIELNPAYIRLAEKRVGLVTYEPELEIA